MARGRASTPSAAAKSKSVTGIGTFGGMGVDHPPKPNTRSRVGRSLRAVRGRRHGVGRRGIVSASVNRMLAWEPQRESLTRARGPLQEPRIVSGRVMRSGPVSGTPRLH